MTLISVESNANLVETHVINIFFYTRNIDAMTFIMHNVTDLHYYDINMTISDHKSRFGDMSANLLTGELPNQPVYISSYLAIQFKIRGKRREV